MVPFCPIASKNLTWFSFGLSFRELKTSQTKKKKKKKDREKEKPTGLMLLYNWRRKSRKKKEIRNGFAESISMQREPSYITI